MTSSTTARIDPDLPLFARRLKAARLRTGLSQEGVGLAAGVDEFSASSRVNNYERGKRTPDVLMATHLAKALNVPLAYFWAVQDDEAELLLLFDLLDSSQRQLVLNLMQELGAISG